MEDMTRQKLADMLGCSVALIKKYEERFSDWLDTPPGTKGVAVAKVFLPEDVRTLTTIHAMRQEGISYDDIQTQLDEALASGRYNVVRLVDEEGEGEGEEEGEAGSALVPAGQYALILGRYQTISEEVERLREDYESERHARVEAEVRAAKLEAQLEERSKSWWQRLRGK